MAAETPQMETALESMAENSSSIAELLADPEAEVPDHAHHQDRLNDPVEPGLHDLAEEDAAPEDHQTGLDVEFRLDGRLEPFRHPDDVADEEPQGKTPEHVLEPIVEDRVVARNDLGDPRNDVHHGEADDERTYLFPHERHGDDAEDEVPDQDVDGPGGCCPR